MKKFECDVLVIGAGLSGLITAATAVQQGKSVIVVSEGRGSLYLSSGFIDVLGYYPDRSVPLQKTQAGLKKLIQEQPEHPYSVIGLEKLEPALKFFLDLMRVVNVPYTGDWINNRFLPTSAGTLAPTALVPDAAGARLEDFTSIMVIGFREMTDFYPQLVAENLRKQLNKQGKNISVAALSLCLDAGVNRELNSFDVALLLEKEEVLVKLANLLKQKVSPGELIITPAVLGTKSCRQVLTYLEESLQCTIMEVATLPPSVAGWRLAEGIIAYLKQAGVEFIWNNQVTKIETADKYCQLIYAEAINSREVAYQAGSYVLATGGILGGGFTVYPRHIEEVTFKIPVCGYFGETNNDFFAKQLYAYSGIKVTPQLQPLDNYGRPFYKNVYIAGRNLYGYDPFIEKSGNGVAVVSGYHAGIFASRGAC